ncbi:phage tail tape measure protein [Fructobacillus fructosus]|uniref:phage tail tape measure protein n=1 Tax=Fructobacillus fructosus TaxID=1631 RepID=UPI002DB47263|nr:Phage-related protein [Fructobacillus fructosus]CAK1236442.1 Phage-related protein [Fructobacillus fructosus]CAK1237731.1 Phage-related protein [Fructobacillus fructosus]
MAENWQVTAIYDANVAGLMAGVQSAINTMDRFADSAKSSMGNIERTMKPIGKTMLAAGAATTALGVTSLKAFGTFEQSLNQAAVIAGGTSKDIGGLSDMANKMGADLPLSAQAAAEAMVAMARDGASISTIKEEFPSIARAATAAGEDLQTTAGVVQQSMNIWGKSLDGSSQAAAILTQTANLSNASIGSMQQALATIGGTASNAGISMQDTSTAIGLLTNRGFSAAQASQDLNHAMLMMQAPSKVAAKQMSALGITFTDAQGNMKQFPQILSEISQKMDGMSSSDKAAALKNMFGTSGMAAILPLLDSINDKTGNTTTSWDAFSKEMQKASANGQVSTDFLNNQATEMQKNIGSKIEQIGGNWESLRNKSMSSKSGVTGSMIDMTNSTIQWAEQSSNPIAKVTRGFVGLSPAIGPAITATGGFLVNVGKIGSALSGTVKVISGMGKSLFTLIAKMLSLSGANTSVAASSVPATAGTKAVGGAAKTSAKDMMQMGLAVLEIGAGLALATGGFAALVFSIAQLAKTGKDGTNALGAVTVSIGALILMFATFGPALNGALPGMGAMAIATLSFGAAVLMAGVGIGVAAAGISLLVNSMSNLLSTINAVNVSSGQIQATMLAMGQGFALMIVGFLATITANAPLIVSAFVNIIVQFVQTLATNTPILIQSFINMLIGMMNGIATQAPQLINSFVNMIVNILNALTANVPKFMEAAVNFVVAMINGLANNLPKLIDAGINLISALLLGIANSIPKVVDNGIKLVLAIVNGIGQALGELLGSGDKIISTFIQGVASGFGKARSNGKSAGKNVSDGISSISLVDIGINLLKGLANGIAQGAAEAVQKAVNVAKDLLKSVKGALGIHSPSRKMAEVGMFTMMGMQNGIDDNAYRVTDSINDMAQSALNAAQLGTVDMNFQMNPVLSEDLSNLQSGNMQVNGKIGQTMQMQSDSLISDKLNDVVEAVKNGHVISMDSGKLVGATVNDYDGALGSIMTNDRRNTL